jgi:hypothetical protein
MNENRAAFIAALLLILQHWLDSFDVLCLGAFGSLGDRELYSLAFFKVAVSVAHNGAKMDKDIAAGITLNETVSLGTVEPLHNALFFFGHDLELLS